MCLFRRLLLVCCYLAHNLVHFSVLIHAREQRFVEPSFNWKFQKLISYFLFLISYYCSTPHKKHTVNTTELR